MLCESVPTRIRENDLVRLRDLEREDGLVHLTPRLTAGDGVRISNGAFEGVSGIIETIVNCGNATQRVRVLMSMLGRAVVKEFDERQLVLR